MYGSSRHVSSHFSSWHTVVVLKCLIDLVFPPVGSRIHMLVFVYKCAWWHMTLGRCPLSILCARGTPPRPTLSLSPQSISHTHTL